MAKKTKKVYYGGRTMLNDVGHHSTGAIVAEIEDTSKHGTKRDARGDKIDTTYYESNYPQFFISDCSRSIALGFSLDSDQIDNDLAKIDKMVELLMDFRRGLAAEAKLHAARKKTADTNRKAEKKKAKK